MKGIVQGIHGGSTAPVSESQPQTKNFPSLLSCLYLFMLVALGAEEFWCKLLARPFLFDDFTAGCSHLKYNFIYAIHH